MTKSLKFTPGDQQTGINIDVRQLLNVRCINPKCNDVGGGQVFQQLFVVKKMSALQSLTGKEQLVTIPIYACIACGAVLPEMGGYLLERDVPSGNDKNEK